MDTLALLAMKMIDYDAGDRRRINHFFKVTSYARTIGEKEQLDESTLFILTAAALTHDIGIKVSMEKYGNCDGPHQEKEGPPIAEKMLSGLSFDRAVIDRVCWLIGHHHTYTDVNGIDYQILIEADFLVNLDEGGASPETIAHVRKTIFKTKTGLAIFDRLFPTEG